MKKEKLKNMYIYGGVIVLFVIAIFFIVPSITGNVVASDSDFWNRLATNRIVSLTNVEDMRCSSLLINGALDNKSNSQVAELYKKCTQDYGLNCIYESEFNSLKTTRMVGMNVQYKDLYRVNFVCEDAPIICCNNGEIEIQDDYFSYASFEGVIIKITLFEQYKQTVEKETIFKRYYESYNPNCGLGQYLVNDKEECEKN